MKSNRYGRIAAEIYDIDKPFGHLPDTEFYLARLATIAGPILEPACGTGRTLVPLRAAGLDVCGFEPSVEMLDRCRARCAVAGVSSDLSRQRCEDFTYPRRFAAIIMPVSSFSLIDDFATAIAVLQRFHAHLVPGGLLMLDLPSLGELASSVTDRRRWTADNGDILSCEGVRVQTDWRTQTGERLYRYERWRDHVLVETQLEPMRQRFWGIDEFRLALDATGFNVVAVTGGYDRSRPVRSGDRVLTFEASRR